MAETVFLVLDGIAVLLCIGAVCLLYLCRRHLACCRALSAEAGALLQSIEQTLREAEALVVSEERQHG